VNDETKVALERAGFVRDGDCVSSYTRTRFIELGNSVVLQAHDTIVGNGLESHVSLSVTEEQIPATLAALVAPTPSEAMRDFTDEELDRHEAWIRSKGTVVKRVFDATPPTADLTEAQLARVREAVEYEVRHTLRRWGLVCGEKHFANNVLDRLRKEVAP
jgi:hypothetical protein